MFQEQMSQGLAFMDVVNNVTTSNNTISSAQALDMSKVKRALYIANVSSVASGVISFQLQASAQSNFNATTNITGTNTGNLNTNNQFVALEVRADQVTQLGSSLRYVRISATANGNTTFWAVGLGGDSEQKPASQYNLNSTFFGGAFVCNT